MCSHIVVTLDGCHTFYVKGTKMVLRRSYLTLILLLQFALISCGQSTSEQLGLPSGQKPIVSAMSSGGLNFGIYPGQDPENGYSVSIAQTTYHLTTVPVKSSEYEWISNELVRLESAFRQALEDHTTVGTVGIFFFGQFNKSEVSFSGAEKYYSDGKMYMVVLGDTSRELYIIFERVPDDAKARLVLVAATRGKL